MARSPAQLVQVGPADPFYCDRLEVKPNLILGEMKAVSGRIVDTTRAPFSKSRVELRRYVSPISQTSVEVTTTDGAGRFHLHDVPPGSYRLLLSPNRNFD